MRAPWIDTCARLARRYWLAMLVALCGTCLLIGAVLAPIFAQIPAEPTDPWWSPKQRIGITMVEKAIKRQTPIGRNVQVGHVEGTQKKYLPDIKSPSFKKVMIRAASGRSEHDSHATMTARIIYGPQGLAPGIRDVHCYSPYHWLRDGYLRAGTADPPVMDDRRLFTHSWIADAETESDIQQATEVLRRIDYLVDHRNLIMVVGVNNGGDTPVPAVLSSAYNVIAVGSGKGESSGGFTRVDGKGRCKPDLVGPSLKTSFATPMVTALAARLLETADRMTKDTDEEAPNNPDGPARLVPPAARSELIKAVLMAGAVKPPSWQPHPEKPLDEHLGAGMVRFDNSYVIHASGQFAPGRLVGRRGWDVRSLSHDGTVSYPFVAGAPMGEYSLMVVWNRRVDGRVITDLQTDQPRWIDDARLANFDLRLLRIDSNGSETVIVDSLSTVDNIEHIYLPEIDKGRYRIDLNRTDRHQEEWEYAIAWRLETRKRNPDPGEGDP